MDISIIVDEIASNMEVVIMQRAYESIVADLGMFDPCELEWYIELEWVKYCKAN